MGEFSEIFFFSSSPFFLKPNIPTENQLMAKQNKNEKNKRRTKKKRKKKKKTTTTTNKKETDNSVATGRTDVPAAGRGTAAGDTDKGCQMSRNPTRLALSSRRRRLRILV